MRNLNEQKLISILTERFGIPIGMALTGPGVFDERDSQIPVKNEPPEPKISYGDEWFDEAPEKWSGEK